jgi:hypothetical protein
MHTRLASLILNLIGVKRPTDDDLVRFVTLTKIDKLPIMAQIVLSYCIPWIQFLVDNALKGEHEEKLSLQDFLVNFSDFGNA